MANANEIQRLEKELQELDAEIARLESASPKKRELKKATPFTEDVSNAAKATKEFFSEAPEGIYKGISSAIKHPKQAAAGLIPGAASIGDLLPLAYNALNRLPEYAVEKMSGYELPEEEKFKKAPYIFQKAGNAIANKLVGAPQTEEEQYAREAGSFGGGLINPIGPANAVIQTAKQGAKAVTKKALGFSPEKYKAFKEVGATPTLADVTSSKFIRNRQNALTESSGAAGVLEEAGEKRAKEFSDLTNKKLNLDQQETLSDAGKLVEQGSQKFNEDVSTRAGRYYDAGYERIDPKMDVPLPKTSTKIQNLYEGLSDSTKKLIQESPGGNILNKFLNAIESPKEPLNLDFATGKRISKAGTLPFNELKQHWKPRIGDYVNSWGELSSTDQAILKNIYGTLNSEMKDFVRKTDPKAAKLIEEGDAIWRKHGKENKDFANSLINNKNPIQAYESIANGLKKGDTKPAQVALSKLDHTDQIKFKATFMNELGFHNGEYSPEVWAKNWSKLRPATKNFISGKDGAERINKLARVINDSTKTKFVSDSTGGQYVMSVLRDYLKLGSTATTGYLLGGPIGGIAGLAAKPIASNYIAKKMTDSKFIDGLAAASKARTPVQLDKIFSKYTALPRMEAIREQEINNLEEEIKALEGELGYSPESSSKNSVTMYPAEDFGLTDEEMYSPAFDNIMRSKITPQDEAGFNKVLSGE